MNPIGDCFLILAGGWTKRRGLGDCEKNNPRQAINTKTRQIPRLQ
jgi:hypothetical protein